ncbi:tetratricopeptide repeat protein [Haliangium sp.]|uniref:tetratricopeptide repeat protein n=1 Tax=Haliangium sp. TaxID=2663208 RepID=UPI003D12F3F6
MRRSIWIPLLLTWMVVSVGVAPAAAQNGDSSANDDRARELYERGDRYYLQGKYEAAIASFEGAYELSGRPPILVALANSYERLGRYEDALDALRRYLPDVNDPAEKSDLEERIRVLEVRVDERQRADGVAGPVVVDRDDDDDDVALPPAGGSVSARSDPGTGSSRRFWAWTTIGVGGAALATGAVLGAVVLNAKSEVDSSDECRFLLGRTVCLEEQRDLIDRNRRLAPLADVGLVVGAVAVTTGIILLLTGDGGAASPEGASLSIGPGGVQVGVSGRF